MSKIEIISEWRDDLCWCPSQCYLNLSYNNQFYILYLRWRHNDPWSACVILSDKTFDMHIPGNKWNYLEFDWKELDDLNQIKIDAINKAKALLYSGLFTL